MKLDWQRIKRTAIQSAAGAGVAAITTLMANFSTESLITAAIEFGGTVIVAVLMNIQNQAESEE